MRSSKNFSLACAALAIFVSACTGNPGGPLADRCSRGIDNAYDELMRAQAKGFDGSVSWTKAASLLSAAKVQHEFEHYPNCIDKVRRARVYIREAQSG